MITTVTNDVVSWTHNHIKGIIHGNNISSAFFGKINARTYLITAGHTVEDIIKLGNFTIIFPNNSPDLQITIGGSVKTFYEDKSNTKVDIGFISLGPLYEASIRNEMILSDTYFDQPPNNFNVLCVVGYPYELQNFSHQSLKPTTVSMPVQQTSCPPNVSLGTPPRFVGTVTPENFSSVKGMSGGVILGKKNDRIWAVAVQNSEVQGKQHYIFGTRINSVVPYFIQKYGI